MAIEAVPQGGLLPVEDIVLPPHHFEAAGGLYRWNGVYYASGQSGPPQQHDPRAYSGREVLMHRSPDFVRWSETASVGFLRSNQRTQSFTYGEGEETHEGVSVWHRGNVLLGIYGIWHGAPEWAGGRSGGLGWGALAARDAAFGSHRRMGGETLIVRPEPPCADPHARWCGSRG